MHRHTSQTGAALIMLLGMIAALAILAATLVLVVVNQQYATANVREKTQSLYVDEAALDSGVRIAQITGPMPTTSPSPPATGWLDQAQLDKFLTYFPHDAGTTVDDQRLRRPEPHQHGHHVGLQRQPQDVGAGPRDLQPEEDPLPCARPADDRALLGGAAQGRDVQRHGHQAERHQRHLRRHRRRPAVAQRPALPRPLLSAGGTWTPISSSRTRSAGSRSTPAPTDPQGAHRHGPVARHQGQRIGQVGSTTYTTSSPGDQIAPSPAAATYKYTKIAPGTVGYLSDYFDQAAQAELIDESQEGGTPATAPTAPASWTSTGYTSISSTLLSTITGASYTNTSQNLYLPATAAT